MATKTYADYAYEKMIDLYNNHSNEVGSELFKGDPDKYSEKNITNCIIYSVNAMEYAFNKIGNAKAAKEVRALVRKSGVGARSKIGQYLWLDGRVF